MSKKISIYNPYSQELVDEISSFSQEQADQCLKDAFELFQNPEQWASKHLRIEWLEKIALKMQEKKDHLIKTAVSEGGKPWADSTVEVERAIQGVKIALYSLHQQKGEEIPMGFTASSSHRLAFTIKKPIGVVFSISAFNHPLNLAVHQIIPALAVGCPVIIKPANLTPLSARELIKIIHESGVPKAYCQFMPCDRQVAEKIVGDKRISFLSFIGSARVGWHLRSKLATGAHCALEHGGVAPVIIDQNVNVDSIILPLVKGGFYHAGQVCVSVQRVYIPNSLSQEFISKIVPVVESLKTGDSMQPDTEVGPLITPKEVDRVSDWVVEAQEKGATVLCGGKKISDTVYAPTLLLNPPDDVAISCKEVFGPVVCLYTYDKLAEAYQRANALSVCFQSAIFTNNLDNALEATQKLKGKAVMINDHTAFRVDWMPFGGQEESGMGVGGIPQTMEEMVENKMIVFNSPKLS